MVTKLERLEALIWDRVSDGLMSEEAAEKAVKAVREDAVIRKLGTILLEVK